jgi:hypothetical protein
MDRKERSPDGRSDTGLGQVQFTENPLLPPMLLYKAKTTQTNVPNSQHS